MDGGALFSGGGFMPSQTTQVTGSPFSSARKSNSTGLLPLTVKQISQATQKFGDDSSNFNVDGVEVNNVTLVGMVFNKEERATDVSFQIDDGTGRLEVRRWVNDATESAEMANVLNGSYVRVHGHLRSFQGKKHVNAFSVKPVVDFNEVTFHFLESIYIHLYNVKAQGGSVAPGLASSAMNTVSGQFHSISNNYSNHNLYTGPTHVPSNVSKEDLPTKVQSIFEEPQNLQIEQGIHVNEIAKRLPAYSRKQIMDAISFLSNEGTIYSTIDDDHYKSTNAY
eukprot:TRINITY_DN11648_c0_g1_i4.p1 TRINITY_DN11648_c0_g1~~TRINITY_DN11648_c0_g1_i4.p1  ORF type:complete len:280 (+),score=55.24 TRINITY_DN11648_c0_g1_i4:143-982(+)